MSSKLNIWSAISYGFDRLTTRGGAVLLTTYVLFQFAAQVGFQSFFIGLLPDSAANEQVLRSLPFALDLPISISGGLLVLLVVVGSVLSVVAMRAIYADIDSIPTADHTRRLVRTVGVTLIVGIITVLAVWIGSIFFLVPGIFLAVSLIFANAVVIIEDAGVIESLKRSWELTSGNRFHLFGLGVIVFGVFVVGYLITTLTSMFAPTVGGVLSAIMFGSLTMVQIAVLVGAYRQLADGGEQASSSSW
ncbi:hypothetical protein [Natrinema salsiterrestre]|uniref:DUF7847 domain-containing protein n=1 Tax=Natrinema salsiterrestre TaxID=2950540 RepID=A0A9Q4PZR7_9EURY|nr:hypothetical protein [Natrinema salsiterrestre]MDF9744719.1 hypothetical protein [Natrinema salsiterrestre]